MEKHISLLQLVDDPIRVEASKDFKRDVEIDRVIRVQEELEQIVNLTFSLDDKIEDAPFYAELRSHNRSHYSKQEETILGIRFSSFGNLFTIWNYPSTLQLSAEVVDGIVGIVGRSGFVYISFEYLQEAYNGSNSTFFGKSWFERYFDYI